jgi:hypothetical protein
MNSIIDVDDKYYSELPVGSRIWSPCSGIESLGIGRGHIGRIDIYLGDKNFSEGGWVSKEIAEQENITLSNKDTLCQTCKIVRDEILNKSKS